MPACNLSFQIQLAPLLQGSGLLLLYDVPQQQARLRVQHVWGFESVLLPCSGVAGGRRDRDGRRRQQRLLLPGGAF